MTTTAQIAAEVAKLDQVERVAEWNDRIYVNIRGARNSRAKADTTTKIWIKGDTITVEGGSKGYHSDEFIAARDAVIAAAETAGATVVRR